MVKLSVIVPCYNIEAFIADCVKSIVSQTYKDWELILVDDGSTDHTGDICDQLALSYPNITVIHQENQGVSAARRAGLKQANGNWIMFVDGDDMLPLYALERMINICMATNVDVYVGGSFSHTDKGYIPVPIKVDRYGIYSKDDYVRLVADYKVPMSLWSRMFRKEILDEMDICIPRYITNSEDYLFNLFVSTNIGSAYISEELIYNYNQRQLCKERIGRATNRQCNWGYWEKYFIFLYENYKKYNISEELYVRSILVRLCSLIRGSLDYNRINWEILPFELLKKVNVSHAYSLKQNMAILFYKHRTLSIIILPLIRIHPKKVMRVLFPKKFV